MDFRPVFLLKLLGQKRYSAIKFLYCQRGIANRILFVEAFGLSVLAAFGISSLADPLNLKRAIKIGLAGFLSEWRFLLLNTLITKTSFWSSRSGQGTSTLFNFLAEYGFTNRCLFFYFDISGNWVMEKRFKETIILGIIAVSFFKIYIPVQKIYPLFRNDVCFIR